MESKDRRQEARSFQAAIVAALQVVESLVEEHGAEVIDVPLDTSDGSFTIRLPVRWEQDSPGQTAEQG